MSYWKLKKSRVAGKVPTLNELDRDTIVLNQKDGIAYVRKLAADIDDPDTVVPIGDGVSVVIPQLKCEVIKDDPLVDSVRVWWESRDDAFTKFNPRIWLFREKNYKKKEGFRKKKFTHEPHLNGVNFENKNFWNGSIRHPFPAIESTGRQTEWVLTAACKEKQLVPIEIFKYFYGKSWPGGILVKTLLDKDFDFVTNNITYIGATGKRRQLGYESNSGSITFCFAIVIDNNDISSPDPVIIGPLSHEITIYPATKFESGKIVSAKWIASFNKKMKKL